MWKQIRGYEGLYEVSDKGIIRRVERKTIRKSHGILPISKKVLKQRIDRYGYAQVALTKGLERKSYGVHRLVLIAFSEHLTDDEVRELQVNHIDGNKLNNVLPNLEWVTPAENVHHAIKTKLRHGRNHIIGKYKNGKLIATYKTKDEAAKYSGLSVSRITILLWNGKASRKKETFKYIKS